MDHERWFNSDNRLAFEDRRWSSRSTFGNRPVPSLSRSQKHRNTSDARSVVNVISLTASRSLAPWNSRLRKGIRPRIASKALWSRLKCSYEYTKENIGESIIEHLFREWYFFLNGVINGRTVMVSISNLITFFFFFFLSSNTRKNRN